MAKVAHRIALAHTGAGILFGVCLLSTLNGCGNRWDFSKEPGFVVDDVTLTNVMLRCGDTQQGDTSTYQVKCAFSADAKHPAMFVPTGRVLLNTKWRSLESVGPEDMKSLVQAGLRVKGRADPDHLGLTYSAVFESTLNPLFRLDLWSEKPGYVSSHIDSDVTISVSSQKCEIIRAGDRKFYFCYEFGSK